MSSNKLVGLAITLGMFYGGLALYHNGKLPGLKGPKKSGEG